MRRIVTTAVLAALLLGSASIGHPRAAYAAGYDGNWNVLIITEKGDCDQAYRYSVSVENGRLKYQGEAAVNIAGTVADNGVVKVTLKLGDKGASGNGRLAANAGTGIWRGVGSSSACAGRWEAERR